MSMKTILVSIAFCAATLPAAAQSILLTAGQSFDYSFSSLEQAGPPLPTFLYEADFSWSGYQPGTVVELSLYERLNVGHALPRWGNEYPQVSDK